MNPVNADTVLHVGTTEELRASIDRAIAEHSAELLTLSAELHAEPELAFNEHRAAARIAQQLRDAGFDTQLGCYGLDTAIEATFGHGSLRVVVCAEYDALPEIGHACGHNIIASAAVGAVLALAQVADPLDLTVVLLGTPAEENGGGKLPSCSRLAPSMTWMPHSWCTPPRPLTLTAAVPLLRAATGSTSPSPGWPRTQQPPRPTV
ncbi:hypothetical protein [Arthrobacter psychrolactophilus]